MANPSMPQLPTDEMLEAMATAALHVAVVHIPDAKIVMVAAYHALRQELVREHAKKYRRGEA